MPGWDSRSWEFQGRGRTIPRKRMLGVGSRWGFLGRKSVGNTGNTILMVLWVMGKLNHGETQSQEDAPQASPSSGCQWDGETCPGLSLESKNSPDASRAKMPGCVWSLGMLSRSTGSRRSRKFLPQGKQGKHGWGKTGINCMGSYRREGTV